MGISFQGLVCYSHCAMHSDICLFTVDHHWKGGKKAKQSKAKEMNMAQGRGGRSAINCLYTNRRCLQEGYSPPVVGCHHACMVHKRRRKRDGKDYYCGRGEGVVLRQQGALAGIV